MWLNYLYIFGIALIESFGLGLNAKFLQRGKKLPCYITSSINALLYLTVLGVAVENLHNWPAKILYVNGFALGDILTLMFDAKLEKLAKSKGIKNFKKKLKRWRIK